MDCHEITCNDLVRVCEQVKALRAQQERTEKQYEELAKSIQLYFVGDLSQPGIISSDLQFFRNEINELRNEAKKARIKTRKLEKKVEALEKVRLAALERKARKKGSDERNAKLIETIRLNLEALKPLIQFLKTYWVTILCMLGGFVAGIAGK